jgi:hypothetical protein
MTPILLSVLILVFSILGAGFSFLIWRDSSTKDIHDQQQLIRREYQNEEIPMNFSTNSGFLTLTVSVDFIECREPDSNYRYEVRRLIFGSNGHTEFRLSMKWDRIPEEIPELGGMNLERSIHQLETSEEFEGEIAPSGFGKQTIEIFSTRPKTVKNEFNKFLHLVDEAVEQEISRHESNPEIRKGV